MTIEPGMTIEVLAMERFGQQLWQKYYVSDLEFPRMDEKGRWLFMASSEYSAWPCPMMVESGRIRNAQPPIGCITPKAGGRAMTDAELIALAAIVNQQTELMAAENRDRSAHGYSQAYTYEVSGMSHEAEWLLEELKRNHGVNTP